MANIFHIEGAVQGLLKAYYKVGLLVGGMTDRTKTPAYNKATCLVNATVAKPVGKNFNLQVC